MKYSLRNIKKDGKGLLKTIRAEFLARIYDHVRPHQCMACGGPTLDYAFAHTEWPRRVWKCSLCGHAAVYNTDSTPMPSTVFTGSHDRADFYLKHLRGVQFDSVLEIGTPKDFYFLNRIGELFPGVKRFGFQPYSNQEKHIPKNGITMLKSLKNIEVDLIYVEHVIKHIADVKRWTAALSSCSKYFIVETLDSPPWRMQALSRNVGKYETRWHYHWFTQKSFRALFGDIPCSFLTVPYPVGTKERLFLIAYSLGNYSIKDPESFSR